MTGHLPKIDVVASGQCRRRWSAAEKMRMVEETSQAAQDLRASAHPWIERDPATGTKSLRMPLPPPETPRQLANALSARADGLRGRSA